jgi:hypothetical protein
MRTLGHPRITGIGLLSIAAIALTFVAWKTRDKLPTTFPFAGVELSRPSEMPSAATRLPFTFDDVIRYFQDSLAQPPQERRFNYALFRCGDGGEHSFTIAISSDGPDLLVKFHVVDDYGMNIVREFFEAPFIQWKESEQLYALLSMGSGIRTINLPRFDVVFECDNRAETTVVTLMFSPRSRYISYPANPN